MYVVDERRLRPFPIRRRRRRGAHAEAPPKVDRVSPPFGVAVSPDSESVYVTDLGAVDAVSQFDVGPDGALLPKDPATVPAGALPLGVAVRPDGRNVYVTNQVGDTLSQYAVGASGLLEPLSPPTVRR